MRRPARGRGAIGVVVLAIVAILGVVVAALGGDERQFPHEEHEGLFPLCTGCHEGVPSGDRGAFYPEAGQCAGCHDGDELDAVPYTPPTATEPEPFRFSHPEHPDDPDDLACEECHAPAGADRMAVARELEIGRCFDCHGHPSESHYEDAECAICHDPAAETRMGSEWLASLPYPADHATAAFLIDVHGELAEASPARCATCHTRERCSSCHVDAESVPASARIPAAPPSLDLPRYAAHYVAPPSHAAPEFLVEHGRAASVQACATCHTQDDCTACHANERPGAVAALPRAADVMAPGVLLKPRPPSSHALASFIEEHGAMAAAAPSSCTSCHTTATCSDCHEAAAIEVPLPQELAGPSFHPANYMARHSAEAYGRRLECSTCHNTAAFCRDCHQEAGFRAAGRLDPGFHDAEPVWLLRHGQPARMALESCATCHEQRDCLQCHSQLGAFRVSPHGSSFDPERARRKNPAICLACHLDVPGG